VFNVGARLYRATRHHTNLPLLKQDLWFPPADRAAAGRANYADQPVFYCSVHQSPALAEIEAGPYNIVVISEWVTQDRLLVQDLGFEDRAFRRFGVDRPRQRYQLADVENASETELEARRFISDAFLAEGKVNYALTAAIAQVFTESDVIAGIRYPSLALNGRADNFALRPDYVRTKMRLEAATYFWLKSASTDGTYDFDPVADLTGIDTNGLLSWTYRDHVNVIPPGASVELVMPLGKFPLHVPGPTEMVIGDRRYAVVPGAFLEMLPDGPTVKLPDGNIVGGTDVAECVPRGSVVTAAGGKSAAALAHDANSRLKAFQSVMAIAVRSREITQTPVSVAAVVTLSNLSLDSEPWTCSQKMQSAFEFHNPQAPSELIAWWTILRAAQASPTPLPALVLVEGGVETLAAINARKQPLIGTELLPEGFTLAWSRATTDATDFVSSDIMA
jgi:RES domain